MVKEKRKEKWKKRNRGEERKETRDEAKRYTASSPFKDSSTVAVNRKVKKTDISSRSSFPLREEPATKEIVTPSLIISLEYSTV